MTSVQWARRSLSFITAASASRRLQHDETLGLNRLAARVGFLGNSALLSIFAQSHRCSRLSRHYTKNGAQCYDSGASPAQAHSGPFDTPEDFLGDRVCQPKGY